MSVIDLLFPRLCFGCGFMGSYLCLKCQTKFVLKDQRCLYCQKKSLFGQTHSHCQRRLGIDSCICLYKYNNTLKRVIKKIKYSLITRSIREILPILLKEAIGPMGFYKRNYVDVFLQPVPLYETKEKRRGFNQSDVISKYLSSFFEIQTISVIRRTVNTRSQTELFNFQERASNVKNAFELNCMDEPLPRSVILVDDVITSGSTIKEIAHILKKNGVVRVFAFSLAKG